MLEVYALIFIIFSIAIAFICFGYALEDINIRNKQKNINEKAVNILKEKDFKIEKILSLKDLPSVDKGKEYNQSIFVDVSNKKIAFVDYEKSGVVIVKFNEIVNYEVYNNGNMITSGSHIGGIGLGFYGGETTNKCKDLKLIIRINKVEHSHVEYDLVKNTFLGLGVETTADKYRKTYASLQEAVSFFEVIKHNNKKKKSKEE